MSIERTSFRCRADQRDKLTLEVVGGELWITAYDGETPHDIKIAKPKHARKIAAWLNAAAEQLEQADE